MEGIEVRTQMRARTDLIGLDRSFDDRLGDDVPQVPRLWGERGPLGRDVVAERDQIKAAVHRAHQRRARRRPLLTWLA